MLRYIYKDRKYFMYSWFDPGIEPDSPALQVDSLPAEQPGKPEADTQIDRLTSPTPLSY